jgi:GAF domain-containing protein
MRVVHVVAIKKRPRALVMSDDSQWEWDGWRPRGARAMYMGPRLRPYEPQDEQRMLHDRAVQTIRRASAEDLERLPTELLVQVAAALAVEPENPDAD